MGRSDNTAKRSHGMRSDVPKAPSGKWSIGDQIQFGLMLLTFLSVCATFTVAWHSAAATRSAQRAYVLFDKISMDQSLKADVPLHAVAVVKNTGLTPALGTRVQFFFVLASANSGAYKTADKPEDMSAIDLGSGQAVAIPVAREIAFVDQPAGSVVVKLIKSLTTEQVDQVMRGDLHLVGIVTIRYRDVFAWGMERDKESEHCMFWSDDTWMNCPRD